MGVFDLNGNMMVSSCPALTWIDIIFWPFCVVDPLNHRYQIEYDCTVEQCRSYFILALNIDQNFN